MTTVSYVMHLDLFSFNILINICEKSQQNTNIFMSELFVLQYISAIII